MALTVTVTPGKQFAAGENYTRAGLNSLGNPTIAVTGNLAALSNVDQTGVADGDFLVWNSTSSKWVDGRTAMTGASATVAGKAGCVPAPTAGQQNYFLRGDAQWAVPSRDVGADIFYFNHFI